MDTKKSIEQLFEKISYNDDIPADTDDKLTYVQKIPYGDKEFMYNSLFWFCSQFLQPGTNMLIMTDDEGNPVPMPKNVLQTLSHWAKPHFNNMFSKMICDGIIMYVRSSRIEKIYMNPAFVIKGNSFSKFLLDMFMISADKMMGEHLFAVPNTRYKRNRRRMDDAKS